MPKFRIRISEPFYGCVCVIIYLNIPTIFTFEFKSAPRCSPLAALSVLELPAVPAKVGIRSVNCNKSSLMTVSTQMYIIA